MARFTISGLRGKVGEEINPRIVAHYAYAFGSFLPKGKVVVGRDTRKSSPSLLLSSISGLLFAGQDVIDLGVVPTPTLVLASKELKTVGGMVVTASHNPEDNNGLKFVSARGSFLDEEEFSQFSQFLKDFQPSPPHRFGSVTLQDNGIERHIRKITTSGLFEVSPRRSLKVGVDCCNGAGSVALLKLIRELGHQVEPIYCDATGEFLRGPEPIPENLSKLCSLVREKSLDLGLALDPDGDRISCVDEKGNPIGEEKTFALCVRFVLEKEKGPVVVNLSTSQMIDDIAREAGVKIYRTKIGDAAVAQKLKEVEGVVGGEGNGGVILPKINSTRDALVGAAIILQLLIEKGTPLSQLSKSLPEYFIKKVKLPLSKKGWEEKRGLIIKEFKDKELDYTDGVRIKDKEWWLHIRPSNTEEVIRVIAEARDKEKLEALIQRAREILNPGG